MDNDSFKKLSPKGKRLWTQLSKEDRSTVLDSKLAARSIDNVDVDLPGPEDGGQVDDSVEEGNQIEDILRQVGPSLILN